MRIWVDCTAAAHPLVLRPIIERLEAAGHEVAVTAREYGQTRSPRAPGHPVRVGRPPRRRRTPRRRAALARRSLALARWARRPRLRPGARTRLGGPGRGLDRRPRCRRSRCRTTSTPACSARSRSAPPAGYWSRTRSRSRRCAEPGRRRGKLLRYPGLKEDYYLADFQPDPSVLGELGIHRERILAVVRPPPETSAYHAANPLYEGVLDRLAGDPSAQAVVIPRTEAQGRAERRERGEPSLIVPEQAIDAQSLIAFADLVVGAGGTMNREAVALGTPVYTIFSGRMGAVDERLIADGPPAAAGRPGRLDLESGRPSPASASPRDPQLLVDGSSRPSSSLARGRSPSVSSARQRRRAPRS